MTYFLHKMIYAVVLIFVGLLSYCLLLGCILLVLWLSALPLWILTAFLLVLLTGWVYQT